MLLLLLLLSLLLLLLSFILVVVVVVVVRVVVCCAADIEERQKFPALFALMQLTRVVHRGYPPNNTVGSVVSMFSRFAIFFSAFPTPFLASFARSHVDRTPRGPDDRRGRRG